MLEALLHKLPSLKTPLLPQRPRQLPGKKWERTEEQIQTIVTGYEKGMTLRELAIKYKMGRESLSKLLKDAGVRVRTSGLTSEEIEEARRKYQQGSSLAAVARHFGVDPKTVWSNLKKEGIKMRDSHGREK